MKPQRSGSDPQDSNREAHDLRGPVAAPDRVRPADRLGFRAQPVLASLLDPLIAIDDHGTIVFASDSVEGLFGYEPGELVGRNVKLLMPEPHHTLHDGYLEHYRRTGATGIIGRTREFEVVRKDGTRLACGLSVSRADLPDGGAVFTGTFRDLTEIKRAHAALAQSERRFHALFDQAFQLIGLLRPDGAIVEVNRTALESVGVARADVIGRSFWDTPWWSHSAGEQERIRQAVAQAAQGEFVRCETSYSSRDRGLVEVDVSLKPFHDAEGRVAHVIVEGRDISAFKRAQRAETAMLRSLATIGESAALLAHEIKNPITAVNLALRAVADQIGEDHRVVLEDLVSRMRRLEATMRRTLSFARPLQLSCKRLDATELARESVERLRPEIDHARARVEVMGADVPLVADPQLLDEVLCNLIRNALAAKGENAHVEIRAERAGDGAVLLSVEDDGPGIPPAILRDLFKPFVTGRHDGNGLGLALCRKIVEEHGGTIAVAKARSGGARFEIRFPADGSPARGS